MARPLTELFNEAYADAVAARVPVPPRFRIGVLYNQKIGSNWGYCQKDYSGDYDYIIKLSYTLCGFTSENAILNTMIHELCHCAGAWGHRKLFKTFAAKINEKFPSKYHVSRCTDCQEKMTDDQINSAYKYIVKCPKCGHVWGFHRSVGCVRNPSNYNCRSCTRENRKNGTNEKATLIRIK